MLENARRQVILVLITALAAAMFAIFVKPNLGNDIKGGVQLNFEVPVEHLQKQEKAGTKPDEIMNQTLSVIRDRVDPTGTIEALVTRRGNNGILIELPTMDATELAIVEERIQSLGKLEMRIVATDDPPENGNKFDLAAEKKRLETWLNQGGGKALVLDNWKNIEQFNNTPAEQGGPLAFGKLAWFAHFVTPSPKSSKLWNYSFAKRSALPAVAVFDDAQWNGGVIPANADTTKGLLEYLAVDMKEKCFTGEQLDASGVSVGPGPEGTPVVHYKLRGDLTGDYGDWSEKYIGKNSAIILNNVVKSAPVFKSRIPGIGMIEGDFTQREAEDLVKVLRTGSLRVEPRFVSKSVIGPTLGERSLKLGLISLVAGAIAVFAFMLLYYRMAGLVACVALLLNSVLLYAGMLISQATVTLPGLGGMVLTMGMAVDANVLIYERIREELAKGKDLLRSVRAGFDRAMVTILDTHVTTFLTGLVLYSVGVGPVRGFAVTLMWGLVTTVFTQFFVARLGFHYLLEWKILKQYRSRNWLTGVRLDFVRLMPMNLALSSLVIVGGLIYAATVPAEKMLGLDFTGGANLQMVVERPTTAQEIRSAIEGDAEFKRLFSSPTVNTVGNPDEQGLNDSFNVRIKLTDQMRHEIEAAREKAAQDRADAQANGQPAPPDFVPPYVQQLERVFAGKLVEPAATGARVTPKPDGSVAYAEISLHFQEPVSLEALQKQLHNAGLRGVKVKPDKQAEATQSREVYVEWDVLATVRDAQLLGIVRDALGDLQSAGGKKLVLSNPFPEAEEIGGRMVGELRSAAIGALILSWALIILYLRVRYHEYRYGIAAVLALIHDLLVTFGVVVLFNSLGIVHAEIDLNMIACFLTIVGYSVNDTIVVFDRIRENAAEDARLGVHEVYASLINRSLNQTLSRTVLSSGVTLCAVLAQLLVNWGSGSALESFAFGFSVGIVSGTYSSIYIAAPLLLWWHKHDEAHRPPGSAGTVGKPEPAPVTTAG